MPDWFRKLLGRQDAKQSAPSVKSFKDDQQRQAAYDSRIRGVRTVALDRIVGSVGRYQDFDSRFRLKHQRPSERLQRIKTAMREGRVLPPVKLYQIKDAFYVLDGNHRIAAAKEMDHDEIRAHIVEFIPTGNSLQDFLFRERADFIDQTQLPGEIQLTEVGQYANLLELIERHHHFLQNDEGRSCELRDAADDWYRTIYRPLQSIVRRGRLIQSFPERTLDDLCAYVAHHQWQASRQRRYGIGIDKLIPKDMEAFRSHMAELKECDYPEMQRGITAFILMKVQAKREYKIAAKLFELDEVIEIHSVHGDVDLLVKIVLTRDLLSSDAEIISQFVHENVRQLNGVKSTQTLIPGFSKMKS
ncbi:MAG: Lrp/AsnC ligand binding domain-containing protein [Desulfobacterales bacterium]|nr:Lrp/AsnC ligand binding domain-containing protein [Desulfobacterales bacterium]MDJ0882564.1 Lrp/AsnC ligand binding domain-containing protein [Desulfobacterales bacterium]